MGTIAVGAVFAAQQGIPAQDSEVFAYAIAGVVLLVVGCVLSLLASARRAARSTPRLSTHVRAPRGRPTSASVARLQHDVQRWLKSG